MYVGMCVHVMCVFVSLLGCILLCVKNLFEQPVLPTTSPVAKRYVQHTHPSHPATLNGVSQTFHSTRALTKTYNEFHQFIVRSAHYLSNIMLLCF